MKIKPAGIGEGVSQFKNFKVTGCPPFWNKK